MDNYRYILDKSGKKFECPRCGQKRFVRYIDLEFSSAYLPIEFGRCDREVNCAYFNDPYKSCYAKDKNPKQDFIPVSYARKKELEIKPISYIPDNVFDSSIGHYGKNNFAKYLTNAFGEEKANHTLSKYYIGTSKHWSGATLYWQIDVAGRIRAGKVMLYNSETGKRVKEPFNHITWAHDALKIKDFELSQVLFGLPLLSDTTKKEVCIFESEKTALIADIYLEKYICLATGGSGLTGLIINAAPLLKGRKVIIYPDLNKYNDWYEKLKPLGALGINYRVTDLLEKNATSEEKKEGLDLADYLLREKHAQAKPLPAPLVKVEKPISPALNKLLNKNPAIDDIITGLCLEEEPNNFKIAI